MKVARIYTNAKPMLETPLGKQAGEFGIPASIYL